MGYAHGMVWNDHIIECEIHKIMNNLGIDRMPSAEEIKSVTGNTGLINAIRKRGGMYEWADKLDLSIKESETSLGKEYERHLLNSMTVQGWKVEQMSIRHPYDLMVNDNIKVDVKASKRYYYDDNNYYYTFNLEKRNPTCDLYVCYCINDSYWIDKLLIIPSKLVHLTQLSLGEKSEYDKYIERWDYFKMYDNFYKSITA